MTGPYSIPLWGPAAYAGLCWLAAVQKLTGIPVLDAVAEVMEKSEKKP
jgi:hypothetical protein